MAGYFEIYGFKKNLKNGIYDMLIVMWQNKSIKYN